MDAEFKGSGLKELKARTARAIQVLDAGQGLVLRDLADIWRHGEEAIFRTAGAVLGSRWAPLKPSTRAHRLRLLQKFGLPISPSSPILVNFGDLKAAATKLGGAQHQKIAGSTITVSIAQEQINRHNRKTGTGVTETKTGKRRKIRGKAAGMYPPNMIDIQEARGRGRPGRKIIGTPGYVHFEMEARVHRYLNSIAKIIAPQGS